MTDKEKLLFFKQFGFVQIHNDPITAFLVKHVVELPSTGIAEKDVTKLVQTTLLSLIHILFEFDRTDFHQDSTLDIVNRTRSNRLLNACIDILYGQGVQFDFAWNSHT